MPLQKDVMVDPDITAGSVCTTTVEKERISSDWPAMSEAKGYPEVHSSAEQQAYYLLESLKQAVRRGRLWLNVPK